MTFPVIALVYIAPSRVVAYGLEAIPDFENPLIHFFLNP